MAAPQRFARMVVVEKDRYFLNMLWSAGTARF
jgi:hypothetical protein